MLRLAARQAWRTQSRTGAASQIRCIRSKADRKPSREATSSSVASTAETVSKPSETAKDSDVEQLSDADREALAMLNRQLNVEFEELRQLQSGMEELELETGGGKNFESLSADEQRRVSEGLEAQFGESIWDENSLRVLEEDPEAFAATFAQDKASAKGASDSVSQDGGVAEATLFKPGDMSTDASTQPMDPSDLSGVDPRELFNDNVFNPNDPVQALSKQIKEARALNPSTDYSNDPEPWDPSHLRDATKLPRRIESIAELGPDFTEEEYAASLIHGRSVYPPFFHSRVADIPAGVLHLRSHHPKLLEIFSHFALHAASSLAIPTSKTIMLPTQRSMWTVIRSPFVYKKSQENFERKVHKRCIKAWDADPVVVDTWLRFLKKHAMGGVGMRFVKWERLPIGLDNLPSADVVNPAPGIAKPRTSTTSTATLRKRKTASGQQIEELGQKIASEPSI